MNINKLETKINETIRVAMDKSGVQLNSASEADKEKLIDEITNSVLFTFDDYINESTDITNSDEFSIETDEEILWKGRPFLSLTESYIITSERIKVISGLIARKVENYELIRIQDIDYKQSIGERIVGLGDITIQGHDPSDPKIVLRNISKPEDVYETLRRGWLNARKKHGLQFREYM